METGFVSGKPRAFGFHSSKWPHGHRAIIHPGPWAAPMLQPDHFLWSFTHKCLHCILVAHPIAPGNGIVGMQIMTVGGFDYGSRATFGGNCVAAHGIYFGNYSNIQIGIGFGGGNCCTQPRTTGPNNENITFVTGWFHFLTVKDSIPPYILHKYLLENRTNTSANIQTFNS
jgi:hypothetical protein